MGDTSLLCQSCFGSSSFEEQEVPERSQQMRSRISTYGLVVALFIVWGAAAFAQESAPLPSGHGHAIAAVRIAACTGMSKGAPCSFSHHGQQVKGICHASRQGQ